MDKGAKTAAGSSLPLEIRAQKAVELVGDQPNVHELPQNQYFALALRPWRYAFACTRSMSISNSSDHSVV